MHLGLYVLERRGKADPGADQGFVENAIGRSGTIRLCHPFWKTRAATCGLEPAAVPEEGRGLSRRDGEPSSRAALARA